MIGHTTTTLRVCLLQWARERLADWPGSTLHLALWYAVDSANVDPAQVTDLLALFAPGEHEATGQDAVQAIERALAGLGRQAA